MAEFTNRHSTDGNVAIGVISSQYLQPLDDIAKQYLELIDDKTVTTHHTYYTDLLPGSSLYTNFKNIQYAGFWEGLRIGSFDDPSSFAVIMQHMTEMNEIYYSNPKPNFKDGPLYGAAANLIPHRDCILFRFPGIRVYRAIIGATDGNHDTVTEFITHGVEKRLNKGDYMVFDFDRTLHQVKKTGQTPTPRIILKLHFLALDVRYVKMPWIVFMRWYVDFAYLCYVTYYRVARYTEQLGTDPKTPAGFFFGILWEYPFYPNVCRCVAGLYLGVVGRHTIRLGLTQYGSIAIHSTLDMAAIYLCIVVWFWLSYLVSKNIYSVKEDK